MSFVLVGPPTLASIHRRTAWRTSRSSASLLLTTPTTTSSQVKRWWLRGVGHRLSRHLIFLNGLCWCLPRSWTEAPDVETVPETLKDSCVSVSTLPQSQSSEVNLFLSCFIYVWFRNFTIEIEMMNLRLIGGSFYVRGGPIDVQENVNKHFGTNFAVIPAYFFRGSGGCSFLAIVPGSSEEVQGSHTDLGCSWHWPCVSFSGQKSTYWKKLDTDYGKTF